MPKAIVASIPGPPSSTSAMEGRLIAGRYIIRRLLGEGAMGRVYLGEHLELGRLCAIKVIRSRGELGREQHLDAAHDTERTPIDEEAVARFRVEALAASRLDHPNVLRVFDFGCEVDDRLWYLVAEHLDGEDLIDVLDAAPLETSRILSIARQVCSALHHAHDHGVVHRDLKPENVRLVQREEDDGTWVEHVKVLDFGTARILTGAPGPDAFDRVIIGTPAYMSPEQACGEEVDGRSDVYSLGVLLFEMATGRLPFERASPIALAAAHVQCPPPIPSAVHEAIDPELESIILWCLRKKRSERPGSARELRDALDRVAARQATITAVSRLDELRPSLPPHPTLSMARQTEAMPAAPWQRVRGNRPPEAPGPKRVSAAKRTLIGAGATAMLAWAGWLLLHDGSSVLQAVGRAPMATPRVATPLGAAAERAGAGAEAHPPPLNFDAPRAEPKAPAAPPNQAPPAAPFGPAPRSTPGVLPGVRSSLATPRNVIAGAMPAASPAAIAPVAAHVATQAAPAPRASSEEARQPAEASHDSAASPAAPAEAMPDLADAPQDPPAAREPQAPQAAPHPKPSTKAAPIPTAPSSDAGVHTAREEAKAQEPEP